jgi:hypothetical protein
MCIKTLSETTKSTLVKSLDITFRTWRKFFRSRKQHMLRNLVMDAGWII